MASIISQDILPRTQLVATDGQKIFNYNFLIFADTDLKVYKHALNALPNDADDLLTYGVDYTVQNKVLPDIGGTITLVIGATVHDRITIIRDMPEVRLNNYSDGGLFRAEDVNNDLDRGVLMSQTNSMFSGTVTPQYPVNAEVDVAKHKYLPILPPLCSWRMNSDGTGIEAFTLVPNGGGVILPTAPTNIPIFDDASGTVRNSGFSLPSANPANGSSAVVGDSKTIQFATIPGKNLIVNGDFRAKRRGTSFDITNTTQYGPEMWQIQAGDATNAVFSLVKGFDGEKSSAYRVQRKSGNAGVASILLCQTISMTRCFNIASKKISISFDARKAAGWSVANSALGVLVISGAGTNFPVQDVSNLSTGFFGPDTRLTTSKTLSTAVQRFHDTVTVPANATQLYLQFTFNPGAGAAPADDYFEISNVQIEVSDSPTPFEILTNAQLQHECNYYYRNTFLDGVTPAQGVGINSGEHLFNAGVAGANLNTAPSIPFVGEMRIAPTVTFYNPVDANAQVRDETANQNCSATAVFHASANGFSIQTTGNAATAVGNILGVHWAADANLV